MSVRFVARYTRRMAQAMPNVLFVFGDNMKHQGRGGQAKELRGEPNAVGIPTKWEPTMRQGAFFRDSDYEKVLDAIDDAFCRLEVHVLAGGTVVWPASGVGTGLARLDKTAPAIYDYIQQRLKLLQELGT